MNANSEPTVFVVDDDQAVCNAVSFVLELACFKVETYPSAEQFLAAYDFRRPGCLLLDIGMPGMGGFDLQEKLTNRRSPLSVIFMTGHGSTEDRDRAYQRGAVGFIEKPFLTRALIDLIRSALPQDRRDGEMSL